MASVRERTTVGGVRSWQVLYRHGTKQPSQTFETPESAEELKNLINAVGADRALKMLAAEQAGEAPGLTVAELWAKFIEWKSRPEDKGGLTPRTLNDYQRDYANYVEPWFGHRTADLVDEVDVQEWVDHMAKTLAPKTVGDRHMLLHSAYDFGRARSRRLVEHNPCKETVLPRRGKRKPPKGTTTVEFRAIRAAAHHRNPAAEDLILFIGETGWRFSEATALDVRDVEDDGVNVWVNVTRVFRLDGSGRQYMAEDEAKSEAGFRRIRMFPDTAAMLRRRVVGKGPGDLVFLNSRGRLWNQNTFLRDTWPRIIADAGVVTEKRKPTPHWLRHMHVAVCLAAGAQPQEVQRRIGHEHFSTTMDVYGGMIGDISDDAIEQAAALMSGARTAQKIAPVVVGEVIDVVDGTVVGELEG